MRAGDDRYMQFVGLVFNQSDCIAAVRKAHGYASASFRFARVKPGGHCPQRMPQHLV